MKTDFKEFFLGLDHVQREQFAKTANTSSNYIRTMLIYKNRKPSIRLISNLANASNGELTVEGLTQFFLEQSTPNDSAPSQ